ncbi:motility associated factor glycosyltransferase family protein [Candidatus Clostridium radicumherbarum]|uniref:Motility associated factor glycosyltransferase family protein n=1 Tax=Candidatus Clostridium radicumherbarum TaxID=3381662 RepID=A0ABW8TVC1_9CLOT
MFVHNRDIEILDTREGNKTLRVNNTYMHSKYYPSKEAETFIDNNKKIYIGKKVIVVYGLGLGYHIYELLKKIESDTMVYIFDVDEDLINVTSTYELVESILKDKRVKLYFGYSKEIIEEFSRKINMVEDLLIFRPALNCLPEKFIDLRNVLNSYELGKTGVMKDNELMSGNEIMNTRLSIEDIANYFQNYSFINENIIIVSAGPSLNENIEKLKTIRKKVKVFVVGSALKALINNDIIPDMICIIDPHKIIYNQIKGYEDLNIPLCFLSTASNLAVSIYKGPKYIFYNEDKGNNIVIDTGKSVATAVLSIAIYGKAKKIIFLGQDLAYIGNRSHCDLYAHDNSIPGNGAFKQVESVNGEMLQTTDVLLYYKYWIEKTINQHGKIEYINCSNGARIEGTKNCDLLDAL